ncbi:MAG: TlpA disulfide reductase family protein [Candidatus Thermoplasmatota archaeon]|nr:TlpA disulfide reductase family protein [Candidatus Thermoplasmatota archaeon]|tara:strand:- start:6 stop:638 length:633 start_codon:yes stop_codon:yes gene_type:complete
MQGKLTRDDNAGAVGSAALSVASLFFIAIMIIAFTANPIAIGTDVGERAPDVEGKAYNGTSWVEFDFESYFDTSWEEGNMSGQWVAIEFMDTDCPYCQQTADEYGQWANTYSANNPNWNGPHVNFLASATELDIPGHETSRAEIQDFRAEYGHNFPYIDDIDQDNMKEWGIPGTPTYFLIQPDGIIAWVSDDSNEDLAQAIVRITPQEGA